MDFFSRTLVDTSSQDYRSILRKNGIKSDDTGEINPAEAYFALENAIRQIAVNLWMGENITVVTPYNKQREYIEKTLKNSDAVSQGWFEAAYSAVSAEIEEMVKTGELEDAEMPSPAEIRKDLAGIKVLTADSVQGSENEVVIVSLVRSNPKGDVGFLRDMRRLNVALSRAKAHLVVIGDFDTLTKASDRKVAAVFSRLKEYALELERGIIPAFKELPGAIGYSETGRLPEYAAEAAKTAQSWENMSSETQKDFTDQIYRLETFLGNALGRRILWIFPSIRGEERRRIELMLDRVLSIKSDIESGVPVEDIKLVRPVIKGNEEYLVSFAAKDSIYIGKGLIFDEVIFHELYVREFGEAGYDDHRYIYQVLQRKIFGKENILKPVIRDMISSAVPETISVSRKMAEAVADMGIDSLVISKANSFYNGELSVEYRTWARIADIMSADEALGTNMLRVLASYYKSRAIAMSYENMMTVHTDELSNYMTIEDAAAYSLWFSLMSSGSLYDGRYFRDSINKAMVEDFASSALRGFDDKVYRRIVKKVYEINEEYDSASLGKERVIENRTSDGFMQAKDIEQELPVRELIIDSIVKTVWMLAKGIVKAQLLPTLMLASAVEGEYDAIPYYAIGGNDRVEALFERLNRSLFELMNPGVSMKNNIVPDLGIYEGFISAT